MANALAVKNNQQDLDKPLDNPDDNFDLPKALRLYYKNGNSLSEIAEVLNTPRSTVHYRLQAVLKMLPPRQEIAAYRDNKSSILDAAEYKLVCRMLDDEAIKGASVNNAAYAFQQVATQNRLEKGLATQIVDTIAIVGTIDDLRKREDEILKAVKVREVQDVVSNKDNVK